MSRKHNYRTYINPLILLLSLGFCLAMLAVSWYYTRIRSQPLPAAEQSASSVAKGNVKTGTLHSPEERQRKPNQIVEEDMPVLSVSATPSVKNGAPTANLLVENPPDNGKRFAITIEEDDTREEIYQSGYLEPEQYIDYVSLDVTLPKGEYPCTVYSDVYRIGDGTFIGRAGAQITPYVLEQRWNITGTGEGDRDRQKKQR